MAEPDDQELELELEPRDEAPAVAPARVCKECGDPLPPTAAHNRQYCDAHSRHLGETRGNGRKRKRDKAPRSRPAEPKPSAGVTTAQIGAMLGEILGYPAPVVQGVLGCDYCAANIKNQGGRLGHEVAVYSETHPWLRSKLELMFSGDAYLGLVFAAAAYALPVVAHHGGLGVPPMTWLILEVEPPPAVHSHPYADPAQAAQGPPEPPGSNGATPSAESYPVG